MLSDAVWIGLRFTSDAQNIDVGPLVDNVQLAFNYGKQDLFAIYQSYHSHAHGYAAEDFHRHFDDPSSGWYTGPALRYNVWCR